MIRKIAIRITAYYIVLMFSSQMFSLFINETHWFADDAENSKSSSAITAIIPNQDLAIGREIRNLPIKMPILKFQSLFALQVCNWKSSIQSFTYKVYLMDKRQKIACAMSSYFHCAKYKSSI
ncbi:MAG TPA: hypothetical protein VIO64_00090 [Pseudobacteroides sp.]|uniref:hypothetical protein n=1 Tax=Pseudobacteroides sp. TaxID=1968840 RepID=UPI002F92AD23